MEGKKRCAGVVKEVLTGEEWYWLGFEERALFGVGRVMKLGVR